MTNCTSCLSLWERWLSEAKTERVNKGAKPSQSPSVTALPEGEPRGCTSSHSMLTREMERICTDTLHSLFYNHPLKRLAFLHIVHYSIIWIQPLGASRRPIWMPVRVS